MPRPDRNREAQALHKRRMRKEGFVRLNLWVHPDLKTELERLRRPSECRGRTIERLILGEARKRPPCVPVIPGSINGIAVESTTSADTAVMDDTAADTPILGANRKPS